MSKAWSVFLPDLLPQLPECPIPLVEHEIKRAAQTFFEKTRDWKITLAAVGVTASTTDVTIVPPAGVDLVRVEQVWYDGAVLSPETGDSLQDYFGDGWQSHTGTPSAYIQETPGVLRLYPIPVDDAVTGLVSRISAKPGEMATSIADDMYVKHREAIVSGAKGRLMLYAGKPWSSPDFGVKHETDFNTAIAKVCATAEGRSRISASPRWC